MGNAEQLEILAKGVETWNKWREDNSCRPCLSGEDIHGTFRQLGLLKGTPKMIPLRCVDFSNADLAGTNLSHADLSEADLKNANLTEANLTYARIDGADLYMASYPRADFSGTEAWNAKFHVDADRSAKKKSVRKSEIGSVADLLSVIEHLTEPSKVESPETLQDRHRKGLTIKSSLYFRGERTNGHCLFPSLMREKNKGIRKHEGDMLRDMISRRPEDFYEANYALAQWVLAQHHNLSTRFLDISKNPLTSLFFACHEKEPEVDGCIRIFDVPTRSIKQFNSDTISVIANFAKLNHWEQDRILGKTIKREILSRPRGYTEAMYYLYQYIKQEKSYFDERINLGDLYRVFVVEPQLSTERVRAQSGAFLVSALQKRFEPEHLTGRKPELWVYAHYKFRIPSAYKEKIRDELKLMNITGETLFPSLDSTAAATMEAYE